MADLLPFHREPLRGVRSFFDNMFRDPFFGEMLPSFFSANTFRTDVKETDKEYIVEAELPGFEKDQIDLRLDDNTLTITATRNEEKREERKGFIRQERSYGSFQRSFILDGVKPENAEASYENGILKIVLPKDESHRSGRHIDIK